jgi:hypothetical protein
MELQIVNKLIKQTRERGFTLHIEDYTTADMAAYGNDFKTAIFDLDEAQILVLKNGTALGWIRLVFGNNGYDLISDYSINLETFLKPINEFADELAGW